MRRESRPEFGGSTISTLFWVVGICAAIFFGVLFVPPYFEVYAVKQVLREAANQAIRERNDDSIRQFVRNKSKQIGSHREINEGQAITVPGIVLLDDNIYVNRDESTNTIIIQVEYEHVVDIPLLNRQKILKFSPSVEGDLTPVKW